MLDFALQFYSQYQFVFFFLLIIVVILEGPITVLALSVIAPSLGLGFIAVFLFSFLWDFLWDVLHFYFWRFFRGFQSKEKNNTRILRLNSYVDKHSLIDTLILIKYTPPLTSIGLLYLWSYLKKSSRFLILDAWLVTMSSLIITSLWMYFGNTLKNFQNPSYVIAGILFIFIVFYFLIRFLVSTYLQYKHVEK